MQRLNLCNKTVGRIWHRKIKPDPNTGCFLEIQHSLPSIISGSGRDVRFLHSCFNVAGEAFVACDHQGNLFHFDVRQNRFTLVTKIGLPCTAMAYNLHHPNEVLIACSDYTLRCYNIESKELVATMKDHASAIHQISIHGSGRFAITSSHDISILWNLDTFSKKRTLNGAEQVGVQQVFFLPSSNTIISCFKDDSIFAWDCDTLKCLYQLNLPPETSVCFRYLTTNRDSNLLVGGGRSQFLYVWNLDSKNLLHIIELPTKMKDIKQIEFLNESIGENLMQQTCIILPSDGILRVINIDACKLLFEIGHKEERIARFSVSPSGELLVCVMESGRMNVCSLSFLIKQGKRTQGPIVQKMVVGREKGKLEGSAMQSVTKNVPYPHWQGGEKETLYRDLPNGLSMPRLLKILKGFGEYPAKYRAFIWRSLLRLPENHVAFSTLLEKGNHMAYLNIHEKYPIKSQRLLRSLQRVLSALAHWAPIFGETEFLPMLAFPIVKMFSNNLLVAFEIIATILVNWGQSWFEYFPNPPLTTLGMIETLLAHHDKRLLSHFVEHNITSQVYSWPLLQTLFSEVVTKDEWMRIWDNIFSNNPAFMLFFIVSYLCNARQALFTAKEQDEFKSFFHHRNAVCIQSVIKDAYRLMQLTPDDINPCRMMENFVPLTRGQYPIFEKYPKFVVDYLVKEREKIRQEELEYLRQKHVALDLKREAEKRRNDEEAFFRQQEMMAEAERQRRELVMVEEQKLADQRVRLQALRREVALKELNLLDNTRRKFLKHQAEMKTLELQRLEDDLQRKAASREQETRTAIDDAEIKALELEAQKRLFQEDLIKEGTQTDYMLKTTQQLLEKKAEVRDIERMHLLDSAHKVDFGRLKRDQSLLAHADTVSHEARMRHEMDMKYQMDDAHREENNLLVAKHVIENSQREEELHNLMRETAQLKFDSGVSLANDPTQGFDMSATRKGSSAQRQVDLMSEVRDLRSNLARRGGSHGC